MSVYVSVVFVFCGIYRVEPANSIKRTSRLDPREGPPEGTPSKGLVCLLIAVTIRDPEQPEQTKRKDACKRHSILSRAARFRDQSFHL